MKTAKASSGKWSTFRIESELLALPVEDVQEVLMMQPLTPVPLAPPHVVGLLNLRGQIMPAIDLRRRLGFSQRGDTIEASLLVIKQGGHLVSLMVDEIGDVLELSAADWRPPPDTLAEHHRSWVQGICPISAGVVLAVRPQYLADDERS